MSEEDLNGHERFMRYAVEAAYKNLLDLSGGPFGACIVRDGEVLAVSSNKVLTSDATSHAEVNAIREASNVTGSFDLSGAVCYATTEPCPMCFAALHWARIKTIYYGTSISDADKVGFNEMPISNKKMKDLAGLDVELHGGVLLQECKELFNAWDKIDNKPLY